MILKKLTEQKYQRKLEKIQGKNRQKEYKRALKTEKKRLNHKIKVETSKLLAVYLFMLLNVIVGYAMVSMWQFADLSYLGVLISDIAAQVLIYAIYCLKAYKAKKSEEDLKFKREQYSVSSLEELIAAGAESDAYVPVNGNVDLYVSTTNDTTG